MKNYAYTFELNELAKIEVFYWDDNFDLQRDELKEKECSWDWMPGGFRLSWLSMAVSEWVSTLVENKISSWLRLTCSNRIVCHIKYIYPNAYQSSVGTCDYGHRIFQRNEYWHPNEKQIIWENAKICVECVRWKLEGNYFAPRPKCIAQAASRFVCWTWWKKSKLKFEICVALAMSFIAAVIISLANSKAL